MPGILPMKVIYLAGQCEHCASQHLDCDGASPKCSHCTIAGIECKKVASRIAQACDRCRTKKIRCDGIRPSCTQCVSVDMECKVSDKLSRRAFPRGYTESLEERVRALESEARDLKDLLDEKDEKIDVLAGIASKEHTELTRRKAQERNDISKLELAQVSSPAIENLRVYTFEVERGQIDGKKAPASNQSQKNTTVLGWMEDKVRTARSTHAAPAVSLLVIETQDDPMKEESKSRELYNEVLLLTKPALDHLGISINVLGTFGTAVFDKSAPNIPDFGHLDVESARTFTYHIALGFFSLAFRYFPESKTCVGILLVQNYKDITAELLRDLKTHQILVGQPLLLPLLAQQAMAKLIASWLVQHKGVIIEAQAQTGYHHMISLSKSPELVDYAQLSAKISGTAVNIVTNELCWQALTEHAKYMVEELREESSRSALTSQSGQESALASFMADQASRLVRNSQAMLREAESWEKKALILVQGIFNLIAQQDQNTSIGIARDSKILAEESKRDSTSMKAIAIVTMTYLPGTFAATLFSMSMFNWDATNVTDVVSHRFWVYWAVTIPLILVTFLTWIVWMRNKSEGKGKRRWI